MKYLPKITLKRSSGQALLLVLLAMAVSLTVVLSVASKSVTEVKISSSEEDALRAFNAAEAGVEEALLKPQIGTFVSGGGSSGLTPTPLPEGGSFVTDVSEPAGGGDFAYPALLSSGDVATFWLVSHTSDGQLVCQNPTEPCWNPTNASFCFGNYDTLPVDDSSPAIEILVYYDTSFESLGDPNNYENVSVHKYAFDPYGPRRSLNGFASTGSDAGQLNQCKALGLKYYARLGNGAGSSPLPCSTNRCILSAKVRLFYADDQKVALNASGNLPAQGFQISSSGTSGESTRNLSVFQSYETPPSAFDSALFSLVDIKHQ